MISYVTRNYNPVTGCTPVGDACLNCWAAATARRFPKTHGGRRSECPCPEGREAYCGDYGCPPVPFSEIVLHPDRLDAPFRWRKPSVVAVCFMGDLWHPDVPDEFIDRVMFPVRVLDVDIAWLLLTKRPERMRDYFFSRRDPPIANQIWLGFSAWNQRSFDAGVRVLRQTPAAHRWVSLEPLLGPVDVGDLSGIDWVVAGCESGPGRRPAPLEWFANVQRQCIEAKVPVYVKQMGLRSDGTDRVVHRRVEALELEFPPEIWRVLGRGR